MKKFSQQFYKKAETTVKLQAAERSELRERVVSYMEYHPLPVAMKAKKVSTPAGVPVLNDAFAMVRIPFQTLFKYSAVAAAMIFVVVPFVAEKAVPGDSLYAIKVQFNEELRSTLTFDSFEKVEWETERLNRRIAEARLLANEGRLTEEMEAEVAVAVRTHTDNAKREIEVLRAEDADEATIASIALDTTLEVQATAMKGEGEVLATTLEVALSTAPSNVIADAIDASRDGAIDVTGSSTLPAYDKLMARVEQNTTRVYELQHSLSTVVTPEESADLARRMEDLDRSVAAAVAMVGTDEIGAQKSLVDVLQRAQRLIVYMTELEVSKTVDINTLVPVVPTEDEKRQGIAKTTAALTVQNEQIEVLLAQVVAPEVREKAQAGQATVVELMAKMASSTAEYGAFTTYAAEAEALAKDTIILLEQYRVATGEPILEGEQTDNASSTETTTEDGDETVPEEVEGDQRSGVEN
jgi:hypothetical protein